MVGSGMGSTISSTAHLDHGFQVEVEYKLPGKEGKDSGTDQLKPYLAEGQKWD